MVRLSLALCLKYSIVLRRSSRLDVSLKRSTPGLKCPPKLWWAKELSPDLHVSGRLTGRQLKYVSEGGFKSVVCLNIDKPSPSSIDPLASVTDAKSIAELVGLHTSFIETVDTSVPNLDLVHQFAEVCKTLEKPLLLTGDTEKHATILALLYLANQSKIGLNDGLNKLTSMDVYRIAATMGHDFTDDISKVNIANVTSEDVISDPPKPAIESVSISEYWPAHRIDTNWYTSGQITKNDLTVLEKAGFKYIINMRMGASYSGKPSQEPVTLLNIRDSLSTYDANNSPTRLNTQLLEENRVYPHIDAAYVGQNSRENFETINKDEFGDAVGYNEDIEREYIENHSGLKYKHMPFPLPTKDAYTIEQFEEFKDDLVSADKHGPVLLHCRIGKRVAYFGILALAIKEGRSLQWAQKRSIEMGHEVSMDARPDVFKIYTEYLKHE